MSFDFLIPILIILFLSVTVYLIFELFVRRKERLMMIEKMTELKSEDLAKSRASFLTNYGLPSFHFNGMRWGLLLLGIGLGIIAAFAILALAIGQAYIDGTYKNYELESVVYGACVCFFGGAMLVGSYYVEKEFKSRFHSDEDK